MDVNQKVALMSNGEQIDADLQDLVGRVLGGRYVLEAYLDRGGYGAVYRATDSKLKQTVAIKVGFSSREFMKEAQLAAAVKHNHIVQVTDYGSDMGLAYLVMEYLHGENLGKLFDRQNCKLTLDQLRKLVNEVGDALACAHADQLIHRDLKPQNIILREHFSSSGVQTGINRFVLLDFGIAAKLDSLGTLKNLTQNGAGTVEYMAPELLKKDPASTPQSDIYAFGVIVYQMIVGRVPFPQEDSSQLALASCLNAISKATPPRFREVAPDRKYSTEIEELVLQCLEKDPARRPQTILEVRKKFLEILDRESAALLPNLVATPVHSNRLTMIVSSVLILVIGAFAIPLIATLLKPPREDRQPLPFASETPPTKILEKVKFRINGNDSVDLATGDQFALKVECLNLPVDSTFVVIPDEAEKLAHSGLHVEVIPQEQSLSTCDVILRADDDAEPISQSIKLSTRVRDHDTSQDESPLFVQARIIWRPRKYQPTESKTVVEADGKYYFAGIQRDVGSISVEFVLVKKPKGFEEPGSFYIMRDKVSRELLEEFVHENPGKILEMRLREIKSEWPEPHRMRWPATGLSGKEAKQVAEWLGGKLPTLQQWKRASGGDFVDPPQGLALPEGWNAEVWKRGPFREPWTDASDQGVALKRFADVGTSAKDESYYGCRDMAGNGTEFLRKPATPGFVDVRGRPINGSKPFLFRELDHPSERQESDPDRSSSFRVVIER